MSDGITHPRGVRTHFLSASRCHSHGVTHVLYLHSSSKDCAPYEATVAAICAHLVKESCESLAASLGACPWSSPKPEQPLAALGTPKAAP
jgi:hypothetical protein